MAHTCHAAGCEARVPPEMFMCKRHWFMLPKRIRDRIWAAYRPGQCDDWEISHVYAETAKEAVTWLGQYEGRTEREIREATRVYSILDPGPTEAQT